ncbi:hypothetical protein MDAP_000575 [Mitosporidium daphniae]|uniref:Uncharacterized protein n=1 Tax=Mitosporidium daphniae TaxID=1485682 RepID=A0A098VNR8_9MICR|nr:uncharacterized protein DI09_70p90 [Mitosporidium daphniae]KGG50414.1 hypothetical protein DI09_70p90 [Mitosporidium daphniae]|eukprot:XP_013236852.1 uncharacterized protein DI09_70p90 [Mitosporidium daphniae]
MSIEAKKSKYASKELSLRTLVTIATFEEKEKLSTYKNPGFFDSLMASLLSIKVSLDTTYCLEASKKHRVEKKTRAILHIIHHLYAARGLPMLMPREFDVDEANVLLSLSLYQQSICDRIRIRAQICTKSLLASRLINDAFSNFSQLEEMLCSSLELSFSNNHIFTVNEATYFLWLVGLLSYDTCKSPIRLVASTLSTPHHGVCKRAESVSVLGTLVKFMHSNTVSLVPCFICNDIFSVACNYLIGNTGVEEKSIYESLLIIKHLLCRIPFNKPTAKLLKLSFEACFPKIIQTSASCSLLASTLCELIRSKHDFFLFFLPFMLHLLEEAIENPLLMAASFSVLQAIRKSSLEVYRQVWLKNGLSCLLKQYKQKNLMSTLDLLCPLFMYSGGVEWLLQSQDELCYILRDIIDACLSFLSPDAYQKDILEANCTETCIHIKGILSFFRLGANKIEWINFCHVSTRGKLLCCLSLIAFKSIEDGNLNEKFAQSLLILWSYCKPGDLQIFTLWPIVIKLRSSAEIIPENFRSIVEYSKSIERNFGLSISSFAFPYAAYHHRLDLKFRFFLLSLYLAKNFQQLFEDPSTSLGFAFEGTLIGNSTVLHYFAKTGNKVIVPECWEYSFLALLYQDHLYFESEASFLLKIPDERCKFCSVASLVHYCNYLNITLPISFLFCCLRKSIILHLFSPSGRKHALSACIFGLFRLSPFTERFKLTLSRLLFAAHFEDVETCVDLIYDILRV